MPIEELNSYYCEECEKWTFIEELRYCVSCAYCGEEGISRGSETYEKLRKIGTKRQ